ncbi:MAG: hypothetical protein E7158_04175 [Firmicutes bacterium]|nr:hypothetical protein [Bacillota bacterium]
MIYTNKIEENFKKYSIIKNKIDALEKEKIIFEIANINELYYLYKVYNLILKYEYELKDEFIRKNPLLGIYFYFKKLIDEEEIKMNKILLDKSPYGRKKHSFIALDIDDGYEIIDLRTQEKIELSDFSSLKKSFVVDNLKATNQFVCFAKRRDLPLLMTLLNENLSNYNMFVEFEKSKMFDDRIEEKVIIDPVGNGYKELKNKLPFLCDDKMQEKWYSLDEKKDTLSKDNYWINYYKNLLLTGEKDILQDAKYNEHLNYLTKAYMYYAKPNTEHIHFRTSDPEINIEMLKLRHKKS